MIRLLSSDIRRSHHRVQARRCDCLQRMSETIFPNRWSVDLGSTIIFDPDDAYQMAGGFRTATSIAETISFRLLSGRR